MRPWGEAKPTSVAVIYPSTARLCDCERFGARDSFGAEFAMLAGWEVFPLSTYIVAIIILSPSTSLLRTPFGD
jgi:hypothetical protein